MKEVEDGTEYGVLLKKMLRGVFESPEVKGLDFYSMVAEAVSIREKFDIIRLCY